MTQNLSSYSPNHNLLATPSKIYKFALSPTPLYPPHTYLALDLMTMKMQSQIQLLTLHGVGDGFVNGLRVTSSA